jgi:sarcosine oxidase, subunit beta
MTQSELINTSVGERRSTDEPAPAEDCGDPAPRNSLLQTRTTFPTHADIIIIGAGIVGAVLAYLLTKVARRRKVVVLERGEIGGGSTQASAACFRHQFTRIFNVQLNQISFRLYKTEIARVLGYDPLKTVGYLFLKRTTAQLIEAMKQAANQRGWNVEVETLLPDAIRDRFPFVNVDKISGATFGAQDGFIKSPASIAAALMEAAAEQGVEIVQRAEVHKVDAKYGDVRSVQTSRGTIEAPIVVNCAGAWAAQIAASAGSYLPVQPIPRQLTLANPVPSIPRETCPMVITPDGAYFRPEGSTLMMGYAPPDTPPSFNAEYDRELAVLTVEKLVEYVPALAEAEIRPHGISGLYEVTPDHNALIGRDAHVRGLYHCAGFSGHGIMQGPGAAQILVELLEYDEVRSLHPMIYAPLRADRFSGHGFSWREDNII